MNSLSRPTILIVDDDWVCCDLLASILLNNYETVVVNNGLDAINAVNTQKIDLVLLDILMPRMDGQVVLEAIKERCKNNAIPIIFISAIANIEIKEKMLAQGAADYIEKSFSSAIVNDRVKVHLALAEAEKEMRWLGIGSNFRSNLTQLLG